MSRAHVPALVLVLAAALLVPAPASAQQRGEDLTTLATMVGPPVAMMLIFDAAMLYSLSDDGTSRRGFGINGLIFSGIGGLMSLSALSIVAAGVPTSNMFLPLAYSSLALSVASGVFSIIGLTRPPPEAPTRPPGRLRPSPGIRSQPSPQLGLLPYWNVSPGGSLGGGGVLSVRW